MLLSTRKAASSCKVRGGVRLLLTKKPRRRGERAIKCTLEETTLLSSRRDVSKHLKSFWLFRVSKQDPADYAFTTHPVEPPAGRTKRSDSCLRLGGAVRKLETSPTQAVAILTWHFELSKKHWIGSIRTNIFFEVQMHCSDLGPAPACVASHLALLPIPTTTFKHPPYI